MGCGEGGVIELFARQLLLPVGIDPTFTSLLRHRDKVIRLSAAKLEALPFENDRFDLVISSWVLEHVSEPKLALAEVARVLKQNGHFVFITPNIYNVVTIINRLVPQLMQSRLVRLLYGREEKDSFPTVYKANSVKTFDRLASSVGLRRVQIELVSDPTYLAFSDLLFYVSVLIERFTPQHNFVHIVGDYVKD
ncbi:MAG: class I SAM-dependent methyltransferase [Planctomycetes bacterium]|nr:class I SAM-dependent methyltransferase [Planctomycetota bacterium]